jgi:hypothetical protein
LETISPNGVDRIFGYILPGYLLTTLTVVLFGPCLPFRSNIGSVALAGFVALVGLPVGFLWVYLVYQNLLWYNGPEHWNEFCQKIANGLLDSEEAKHAIPQDQFWKLKSSENKCLRIHIVEGFFASLQDKYPAATFYHVKHHTIRDLGWILFLVPMARLVLGCACGPLGLAVLLLVVAGGLTFPFALLIADKELRNAERQLAYLASQERGNLITALKNGSREPFMGILNRSDG